MGTFLLPYRPMTLCLALCHSSDVIGVCRLGRELGQSLVCTYVLPSLRVVAFDLQCLSSPFSRFVCSNFKAHWNSCLLSKSNLIVRFSRRKVQLLAANSLIVHQLNDVSQFFCFIYTLYSVKGGCYYLRCNCKSTDQHHHAC